MRVLQVAYSDQGGAAKSCIRLHLGLLKIGVASRLLVIEQTNREIPESYKFHPKYVKRDPPLLRDRIKVKVNRILREFGLQVNRPERSVTHENRLEGRPDGFEKFSNPRTEWDITQDENYQWADIINLHWVAGFIDYPSFFRLNKKPLFWTLHDMNPFTGGCHYSLGCDGYTRDCKNCPQLYGSTDTNYSRELLEIKKESILDAEIKPVIISPSIWLKKHSKASIAFSQCKHYHILYSLDTEQFKPRDKKLSREILGIPQSRNVVLFVAESIYNKRKGFDNLKQLIDNNSDPNTLYCSVGKGSSFLNGDSYMHLGLIHDERLMSMVYSAADLFLITSKEDNYPNTVIEALCCGCPILGLNNGGIPEMVDEHSGLILSTEDSLDTALVKLIENDKFSRAQISTRARSKYTLENQASAYYNLYSTC
ncbi:MAG: glycosyltransferase [Cytophagales bacterium]